MPPGYNYAGRNSLEFHFDPNVHKGYIDLNMTCPVCGHKELREGQLGLMKFCTGCDLEIMKRKAGGHIWGWCHPEAMHQSTKHRVSRKVRFLRDNT